jgi:hypothetical protein
METSSHYLDRCLELLKNERVSETTAIIMFTEYAKLVVAETKQKEANERVQQKEI